MKVLHQSITVKCLVVPISSTEDFPGCSYHDAGIVHLQSGGDTLHPVGEEYGVGDVGGLVCTRHQLRQHTHGFFRRRTEGFESHRHERRTYLGAALKVLGVLRIVKTPEGVVRDVAGATP